MGAMAFNQADLNNLRFADQLAARVLGTHWPDGALPVDPVQIANAMGVIVRSGPLPPDISGALLFQDESETSIIIEQSDAAVRQRFTCAHELGHFVYRTMVVRTSGTGVVHVDFRDQSKQDGSLPEEKFANRFAASLLMPEAEVRGRHAAGETAIEMSKVFYVSLDAIAVRLRSLGLLPAALRA